jgi:hypothetical protein
LGNAPIPEPPPPSEAAIAVGRAIEMLRAEILGLGGTIPSATALAPFNPAPLGIHQPMAMPPVQAPAPVVNYAYPRLLNVLPYIPSVIAVGALIVMMYLK